MNGWNVFKGKYKIGQQDPGTMANYEQWYYTFVDWAKWTHPELKDMREVSVGIAQEYCRYLLGGTPEAERLEIPFAMSRMANAFHIKSPQTVSCFLDRCIDRDLIERRSPGKAYNCSVNPSVFRGII